MDKLDLVLTELQKVNERLTFVETNMATKDDIANMATKDDIANMATKDDIANMATKDDIANMATKDDIANMATKDDLNGLATKKDVEQIPYIAQAVLEINSDVKQLIENQRSIFELLGEHEIEIRSLRRRPV